MVYYAIKQNEKLKSNVDISNFNFKKWLNKPYISINGNISKEVETLDYVVDKIIFDKTHFISNEVKEVFDMYNDEITYRPAVISDIKTKSQILLWEVNLKSSLYLENNSEEEIKIEEDKINNEPIFAIYSKTNNFIIIREDVAECIMKRSFYGILFEKVKLLHFSSNIYK